ncbi:hypothetical protein Tco_0413483 [Tanacetum coccineum]
MDVPKLTMKEYIRLEEEKARKRGKVFNWQTAMYGKIRDDDDLHDLSSVETEFPAIVINNDFATQDALSCKSQVSAIVNEEIDFRISFDESDDEDYTIIYDANSFPYKMISLNDLKTDSKNDYKKVMPLIPSPEPAISCFDDLDFFNDFENKFPAIVYNDAQKSKSDLFTEPILNPDILFTSVLKKRRHPQWALCYPMNDRKDIAKLGAKAFMAFEQHVVPKLGSNALACKVIVTLDKSKLTISGKSSTVETLQWKDYTSSGKNTLAVGTIITSSGNALVHFIPNNPPLNLILHFQIKFLE